MFAPRETLHSTPAFVLPHVAGVAGADQPVRWPKIDGRTTLYDIGCGDGAVLQFVAEKTGCDVVGWEINKKRAEGASKRLRVFGTRAEVRDRNFLDDLESLVAHPFQDPSKAVFFCYLSRGLARLAPYFARMGVPVITFLYPIPGIKPTTRHVATDPENPNRSFLLFYYDFYGAQQLKRKQRFRQLALLTGWVTLSALKLSFNHLQSI
mmetsp:Transcript_9190/g.16125  ORF Transcript_9190/g.16125 Transcript_9190/m.16125 type:complete len:208 (-) Transcript_9190:55-678(-)